MTRFKNYITEGFGSYTSTGRTESLSEDKAIDLIKTHCKNNFKRLFKSDTSIKIYRGIKNFGEDFGYIDTNKGEPRVSANTYNYMTLFMDKLPSWRGWPKRSKSVICTTSNRYAGNYGNLYYVIPYDNTKIGICPEDDVWNSFYVLSPIDVDMFNYRLNASFMKNNIQGSSKNWNKLKKSLSELERYPLDDTLYKFLETKPFIDNFNKLLDPKLNNFKMGIEKIQSNKEIWIQGECIFITKADFKNNDIQNFFNKLKDL